jgi:hypothetical protein
VQALLGKITKVVRTGEPSGNDGGLTPLEITFKAACVLPARTKVPEWLGDPALTVKRSVRDPREIGGVGDSIVLTPEESSAWLFPLSVTPDVAHGKLPDALTLRLRWWKDDKPPEWTARANGRAVSGEFTKEGEDGGYAATVETGALFDLRPASPSPSRSPARS